MAWQEAQGVWVDGLEAQTLRDVGWQMAQTAWKEGQNALLRESRVEPSRQGWHSLEADVQALARQLDALSETDGSPGHLRVRLWERDLGRGL